MEQCAVQQSNSEPWHNRAIIQCLLFLVALDECLRQCEYMYHLIDKGLTFGTVWHLKWLPDKDKHLPCNQTYEGGFD